MVLALVGIGLLWMRRFNRKKRMTNRRWATALIYLTMGWIALIAIYPLSQNFSAAGIAWLIAGGVAYSIGAFCYSIKHPNLIPGVIEYHEVFHFFVLLGTICHFWMIYQYILPIPSISDISPIIEHNLVDSQAAQTSQQNKIDIFFQVYATSTP